MFIPTLFLSTRRDKFKRASHGFHRYTLCAKEGRDKARLNIILQPGLRRYAGLYEEYAEYLSERGANVVVSDFPGHGKSPGESCRIHHIRYLEACAHSNAVMAYKLNKNVPTCWIGFSMGALVMWRYLSTSAPPYILSQLGGIISLGMPLEVGNNAPRWMVWCSFAIAYLLPWWKISHLRIDKDNISHDPKTVRELLEDPMIYKGPLRAWTAYSILQMTRSVKTFLRNGGFSDVSKLYLRGELDNTAQRKPYDEAKIPIKDYKGMKHEILRGKGTEKVREDIDAWIQGNILSDRRKEKRFCR